MTGKGWGGAVESGCAVRAVFFLCFDLSSCAMNARNTGVGKNSTGWMCRVWTVGSRTGLSRLVVHEVGRAQRKFNRLARVRLRPSKLRVNKRWRFALSFFPRPYSLG